MIYTHKYEHDHMSIVNLDLNCWCIYCVVPVYLSNMDRCMIEVMSINGSTFYYFLQKNRGLKINLILCS